MRKIRVKCEDSLQEGKAVSLPEYNAKHLAKVLRKKVGDTIHLFNERDGEWEAKITYIDKKSVSAKLLKYIAHNNIDADITLFFSPIKNPDLTWVVQKATELGAKKIIPFRSERSVVKSVNLEKLNSSISDAVAQSERTDSPEYSDIITFRELLKIEFDAVLFFDESGKGSKPEKISKIKDNPKIAVIIGNEGGFTNEERNEIYNIKNCYGVSLPKLILRAETAIVSALTLVQNYLGEWK